jgi:hypothetical protein
MATKRDDEKDVKRAEKAGTQYADDQIMSDHFSDWVWEQLAEGARQETRDPSSVAKGFETKNLARSKPDAVRLARILLQQLTWDISRDIGDSEVAPYFDAAGVEGRMSRKLRDAFSKTVGGVLSSEATKKWLAEEFVMPICKELMKKR